MVRSPQRLGLTARSNTVNTGTPLKDAQERYLDWHRARHHSPRTIDHYAQTFADLHRWLGETNRPRLVGTLTTSNLQAFSAWLDATPLRRVWRGTTKRSVVGLHGRMKDLRSFVRYCIDERLLPPGTRVVLPKLPEADFVILTDAQLVAVFSSKYLTAPGPQAIRNRALLAVLLDTGVRLAEVASLAPETVYLDDRLLKVLGKGNRTRHVPISASTVEYLHEWLAVRSPAAVTLFDLTADGVRMVLKRIQADVGIHLHAHLFRHQAATMMCRKQVDLSTLRRILGHKRLETVEIYLTHSNADLRDKHDTASPMETVKALLAERPSGPRKRRLSL